METTADTIGLWLAGATAAGFAAHAGGKYIQRRIQGTRPHPAHGTIDDHPHLDELEKRADEGSE